MCIIIYTGTPSYNVYNQFTVYHIRPPEITAYTYQLHIYIYVCCVPIRNEHKKCLSATVAVYTHYTYPPTLSIVMRSSLQSRRRRHRLRRRHEANLCVRGHWPHRRHSYEVHDDNIGRVIGIGIPVNNTNARSRS